MSQDLTHYKKANKFNEIDNAVRNNIPVTANHEFYTDFSDVRGDFEERVLYRALNVSTQDYSFDWEANQTNKSLLFLGGMRGSGKTSELAKIAAKLNHPEAFFCVTCNLDDTENGLDLNDMEYMDILIFQLERLFEEIHGVDHKLNTAIDIEVIESLQKWFEERVKEVNDSVKGEVGMEIEIGGGGTGAFMQLLGLATKLKTNIIGNKENAQKIRKVFKNNFREFALKFNEFIEQTNFTLRRNEIAKEILFIVDGLEKVSTPSIRRKIVDEEGPRFSQINVNTIFTLPIELLSLEPKLEAFSTVRSFPFVKLQEKDGSIIEKAMQRFLYFVYERIDKSLFDNEETVREAILKGGGSPRQLLHILEYAFMHADEQKAVIDREALDKGIQKLAAANSRFLTEKDIERLKQLKENNKLEIPTLYGEEWQDLYERLIVFEYNDGTYKKVNPIIEVSKIYQYYVEQLS